MIQVLHRGQSAQRGTPLIDVKRIANHSGASDPRCSGVTSLRSNGHFMCGLQKPVRKSSASITASSSFSRSSRRSWPRTSSNLPINASRSYPLGSETRGQAPEFVYWLFLVKRLLEEIIGHGHRKRSLDSRRSRLLPAVLRMGQGVLILAENHKLCRFDKAMIAPTWIGTVRQVGSQVERIDAPHRVSTDTTKFGRPSVRRQAHGVIGTDGQPSLSGFDQVASGNGWDIDSWASSQGSRSRTELGTSATIPFHGAEEASHRWRASPIILTCRSTAHPPTCDRNRGCQRHSLQTGGSAFKTIARRSGLRSASSRAAC